jgi:hypothetical protein
VIIDRAFPLSAAAEAHAYAENNSFSDALSSCRWIVENSMCPQSVRCPLCGQKQTSTEKWLRESINRDHQICRSKRTELDWNA